MKRYAFLIVCLLVINIFLSACSINTGQSTIKYERRLGTYMQYKQTPPPGIVDLSDGTKLNYNTNLGPKDLNFDFKLVNTHHD